MEHARYVFSTSTVTGDVQVLNLVFGYIHEIVFILIGPGLFFYGFFKLKKKRLIEDIPTSKIRSVAMGFAEIKGKARQKIPLKSPLTSADCVYYKFLVEKERTGTIQF
ncbi:MAG: hypothetical protein QME42_04345 [bacterium]|nr:hypothetical protein [bacterium]